MSPILNFNQTNQAEIMMRVLFLHRLKRVFFSPLAHAVILTLFTLAIFSLVSVGNVLANLWQSGDFYSYVFNAVSHTELLVQLMFSGAVLFLLVLCADGVKNLKFHRHFTTV